MEFGVTSFKDLAELLSYLVVILGIPVAVSQYIRAIRKEQRDREGATYDAVDDKYIEFQRLCLEYPRLDVWDLPNSSPLELSKEEKKQELIAFTLLLSIFERGFLMKSDMSSEQWTGWHEYIKDYSKRPNFRHAWKESGGTFDSRFEEFMGKLVADNERKAQHGAAIDAAARRE